VSGAIKLVANVSDSYRAAQSREVIFFAGSWHYLRIEFWDLRGAG
jgi:hypothetical protein